METIITFTLRRLDFAWAGEMEQVSNQAPFILLRARSTCVRWFQLLRAESYKVTDDETAQRFQQYALWASLLCRRAFTPLTYRAMDLNDLSWKFIFRAA